MTKLGWPFEDEKEAAVGSLQSQIRPGGESSLVEQWSCSREGIVNVLFLEYDLWDMKKCGNVMEEVGHSNTKSKIMRRVELALPCVLQQS